MASDASKELRENELRQHIGPAIKELREREAWSLRDLSARCGVSSAYLSRIERGASVPSFSILASIASALRVSPDYFIEFERSAKEIESALATVLEDLAIPRSTWHEFADLSLEAQASLVDAFSRLTAPSADVNTRLQQAERAVVSAGVESSITILIETAMSDGLTPVDFARNRTQIEEIENDRFVILDRLCTLPASTIFDQLNVFRGTFGVEPDDPMLLKWWIRAQRSALTKTLRGSTSRAIYPLKQVRHYIREGRWGPHVDFPPELVRHHVEATISLLRSTPNYRIGLTYDPVPLRMIGKAGAGVLVMTPDDGPARESGQKGMAIRFSGCQVTGKFAAYFDDLWRRIPQEHRDSERVADWMERELAAGFAGTAR